MISKKNIVISLLLISSAKLHSEVNFVSYGWELFERVTDSRTNSLANANIAYPIAVTGAPLLNPALSNIYNNKIGITHQSRIAGMINSEFIGFNKSLPDSNWVSISLLYEGVSNIPDTRSVLLDWGADGVFGTFDVGEGNGVIDEGERLDINKIGYFSQNQFGLYGAISRPYRKWQVGLGVKLLFHTIDNHYGLGAGINIGAYRAFKNFHIGVVLNNSPSSGLIWDDGNIELSPGSLSVGMHHLISLEKYNLKINPIYKTNFLISDRTIDSKLLFNEIPFELFGALEVIYKRKIFFRFGLFQSGSLSAGLGLNFRNISIDYSFIIDNSIKGLDNNHLITVGLSSDWIKEKVFN
ncbi:MAG: hypothetical protein CBD77_01030 [bacterium TMED217]|nr:MAG: hypothetical protein CBD77_01030 [bacterium TMED217]|tara:strand:- start:4019 stop:5077 length:1059 start_codon:yes stop_codon:yes gene_type:complete